MTSQERSLETLFFSEAAGRVQTLLERFATFKSSGEERASIAQTLHTLKGSAGMVGFTELAQQIHQLEDLFQTLDHRDAAAVKAAEHALKEIVEQVSVTTGEPRGGNDAVGAPAPFSLAQKLLSSVGRFESLLGSWNDSSRTRVTRDERVRLELSFGTELKELRQHAFRLAFGHPDDLHYGLDDLTRLVAESEGKKVRLNFRADAPYILREYIPELRSVLVHLVSNCVVHGLETPDRRLAKGKDEDGVVEVILEQSADELTLTVCDDGSGVDLAALEAKYRKGGMRGDWGELGDEERLNLLFQEGTSLKEATTLHAGRGVGLSSVRETARRLGGRVVFEPRDTGSRVRFTIPSPFYVAACLSVSSGGHLFSVSTSSLDSVEELNDRRLPTLFSSLNLSARSAESSRFALWVKGRDKKVGVSVEHCFGLKELVVYPAPPVSGMSPAVVGLSESGQRHQLVVDLAKLGERPGGSVSRSVPALREEKRPTVLVVDDSATTRSILVEVLRRTGHQVVEARDGAEALEQLEEQDFDIVVSDLEMPNLDGLEFLEILRQEGSDHAGLPFVLFTSRDDSASFQKALLLGADRCISKADFKEDRFLALLQGLMRAH